MLHINKKKLYKDVARLVGKYYSMKEKPSVQDNDSEDVLWIKDLVKRMVEYAIIERELVDIDKIRVTGHIVNYDAAAIRNDCIKKRNYSVDSKLGNDYGNKYLLKGGKAIKINRIYLFAYEQKDEMKAAIANEFAICKRAEELKIGPKIFDCFICMSDDSVFKVVVSEFVKGVPLDKWMAANKGKNGKDRIDVYNMVQKKLDIMHENGIIHNNMHGSNIIVKDGGKDVLFTDFVGAYDMRDKKLWQYNKWIRGDRRILDEIKTGSYSWNNSEDVLKYVAIEIYKTRK